MNVTPGLLRLPSALFQQQPHIGDEKPSTRALTELAARLHIEHQHARPMYTYKRYRYGPGENNAHRALSVDFQADKTAK